MKQSNRPSGGTSFHGHTIDATYNHIVKAIGFPHDHGDGGYKVNFGWTFENEDGSVFTIYDWKAGRFGPNKVVEWHIGAHKPGTAEKGAAALERALAKIPENGTLA
jgi:hypothetical protein